MRGVHSFLPAVILGLVLMLRPPIPGGEAYSPFGLVLIPSILPFHLVDDPGPWPHSQGAVRSVTEDSVLWVVGLDSTIVGSPGVWGGTESPNPGQIEDPELWPMGRVEESAVVDEPGIWPQRGTSVAVREADPRTVPIDPAPACPEDESSTSIVDDGGGWPDRR